jgi:hypothetical protein
VGFEAEFLKERLRVRKPPFIEKPAGGLDDRPRGKRPVPMPSHAVGDHNKMAVTAVRTQYFKAILLFGSSADIGGYTKLPWHDLLFLAASAVLLYERIAERRGW